MSLDDGELVVLRGAELVDVITPILTGLFTGFGSAIGSYYAVTYAIKHLENLKEKTTSARDTLKQGVQQAMKDFDEGLP